jgi:hypothetical protein
LYQWWVSTTPIKVIGHIALQVLLMLASGLSQANQIDMVQQKRRQYKNHNADDHTTYYDYYSAIDCWTAFADNEHKETDEDYHNWYDNSDQKADKVAVVSLADTIINEGTVMIEHLHAIFADWAVASPIRPVDFAGTAKLSHIKTVLVADIRHQISLIGNGV